MTKKLFRRSVLPLSLCATSVAFGQSGPVSAAAGQPDTFTPLLLEPTPVSRNHISMGFQLGFNIRTSFKHIGRFAPATNPGSTNGLSNHFYDDGYNLVDSSGNRHFAGNDGEGNPIYQQGTWNFGFNNAANQLHGNGDADGTIDMHSTSSSGGTSANRSDDPRPGFVLTFGRELYRDGKDRWRTGLDWSFGYTDYVVNDSSAVNAKATQLTDTYSLFGDQLPTQPSYSQDAGGNPNHNIISDTPTRSLSSSMVPVSGTRKFGADIFAFRLGPYFEVPLNKTFSFSLEGGGALVYVYSRFQYNEEVATPGGLLNVKGSGVHDGIQLGGYLGGKISAALSDKCALFAGAQWLDAGDYVHRNRSSGESAVLNLSQSVFFTSGIGYSF
ncbi:MAG TPA: hypothetical protein VG938_08740 [Verrucomicrobiae bacterium]|jgi:hypothetical protein|nr:hypothetical protein [Verrucomicrobiae bacterium]